MIFVYGKGVTVTGLNGASQTLTRPGFEVTVSGPGASPSDPGPAPPGATAAMLAQLDGRAGGNGGAPVVPTEVTVTNSGIANAISANVPASIQAAARIPAPSGAIAERKPDRPIHRAADDLSGHLGSAGVADDSDGDPNPVHPAAGSADTAGRGQRRIE